MTACVNEKQKKVGGGALSSKVLRAVLAAVLAIGLMPALAFADDGISTMATDDEAWKAATPTYNQEADENDQYVFDYTGKPVDFEVTGLTAVDGTELEEGVHYKWAYYTDQNGTETTAAVGADENGAAPVDPQHRPDHLPGVRDPIRVARRRRHLPG